jgi:Cu2+-exporting ATPase
VRPLGRLDDDHLLALAARMESVAVHPLSQALAMAGAPQARRFGEDGLVDAREVPGQGVEARVNGVTHRIGSVAFVQALHGRALPEGAWAASGESSLVALGDRDGWLGLFSVGDGVRQGAAALVASLTAQGSQVALASGDRPEAVAPAAARLGIAEVHAGMTPEAKHAYVAGLQARGATVAMVGDGLNDAPVLALAHVSVAMGSGAPLAQTRADMVLMSGRPEDLGRAVEVAKKAVRIVRQNIGWAALYNLIAIPLAATGVLTPWMAGIGMSMSSLVVVLNSLRLAGRAPVVQNDAMPAMTTAPQGA